MVSCDAVISLHSVAEAYFYLMVCHCRACGSRPLKPNGELVRMGAGEGPGPAEWTLSAICPACGQVQCALFVISPEPTRQEARSEIINPTPDPSKAIDVLGWLTLFQSVIVASTKEPNKSTGRHLAHEAALCLDEALKFYPEGADLPGVDAFFTGESRQRFVDHPQFFSREKWRQRRFLLPDMRSRTTSNAEPHSKHWWQFWR